MPVPDGVGLLTAVGQTVSVTLGNSGNGNPVDVTAIVSMTGTFTQATFVVEGIPLAQPMALTGPYPPSQAPASAAEWCLVYELGLQAGSPVTNPIGPLSSTGAAGTGFCYTVPCGYFQQLRLRVTGLGSGAIQAGIATIPFPISTSSVISTSPASLLAQNRIWFGIMVLLNGSDAVDLSALTSQDFQ